MLHLQRFTMITGVMYYAGFTTPAQHNPRPTARCPGFGPALLQCRFVHFVARIGQREKCFCEGKTDLASHARSPRKLASSAPLALVQLVFALWTVAWHEQVVQAPIYARPR